MLHTGALNKMLHPRHELNTAQTCWWQENFLVVSYTLLTSRLVFIIVFFLYTVLYYSIEQHQHWIQKQECCCPSISLNSSKASPKASDYSLNTEKWKNQRPSDLSSVPDFVFFWVPVYVLHRWLWRHSAAFHTFYQPLIHNHTLWKAALVFIIALVKHAKCCSARDEWIRR